MHSRTSQLTILFLRGRVSSGNTLFSGQFYNRDRNFGSLQSAGKVS